MREYAHAMFRHWWIDTLCLAMIVQLIIIINTCIIALRSSICSEPRLTEPTQEMIEKWQVFRSGLYHLHAQMVSPHGWSDCACSFEGHLHFSHCGVQSATRNSSATSVCKSNGHKMAEYSRSIDGADQVGEGAEMACSGLLVQHHLSGCIQTNIWMKWPLWVVRWNFISFFPRHFN